MHKWLIVPGSDGKQHITAGRLIELYGVGPRDCMVASSDWSCQCRRGPGRADADSQDFQSGYCGAMKRGSW